MLSEYQGNPTWVVNRITDYLRAGMPERIGLYLTPPDAPGKKAVACGTNEGSPGVFFKVMDHDEAAVLYLQECTMLGKLWNATWSPAVHDIRAVDTVHGEYVIAVMEYLEPCPRDDPAWRHQRKQFRHGGTGFRDAYLWFRGLLAENGGLMTDMHPDNFRLRMTDSGPKLVCVDPVCWKAALN